MKLLKIKYIVSFLIIIGVGLFAGLYFSRPLAYSTLNYDNTPFSMEGFINFNSIQYDEDGNRIEDLVFTFDNNKKIAENDQYVMLFDEETTIARIVKKDTCSAADYSDCEIVYQTARDTTTSAQGANISVRYAQASNGKLLASPMDSMLYSVQFENSLTGEKERHYQVKYVDGGVQILYEIGQFSANLDYFTKKFHIADYREEDEDGNPLEIEELEALRFYNLSTLEGRFRGNTTFITQQVPHPDVPGSRLLVYTGEGYTYSLAAANYIEENQLATVIPQANGWKLEDIDPELFDSYGTHMNSSTSPITNNPFISRQQWSMLQDYYARMPGDDDTPYYHYSLRVRSRTQQVSLYRMFYTRHEEVDILTNSIPILNEDGEPIIRGGFHAVDEFGNFLYDEDGKPVQQLYSLEQTAIDNSLFGIESITSLARFQVVLQLILTNKGLEATILADALQDSSAAKIDPNYDHDYIMSSIQVLPQLTTSYDLDGTGMMVIPDGSGAIIEFNNDKAVLNYSPYNQSVYGSNKAFVPRVAPEAVETLMFGMFGYLDITGKKGIMAIIEQGAAQSSLYADTPRGASNFNTIYYTSNVRQMEMVTAGTGWYTSDFPKWTRELIPFDLKYHYVFLDQTELDYVTLAQKYRAYLIDRYDLALKDQTQSNLVDINFLGAFERYKLFMGIRYMADDTLTTFAQAQEVIQELLDSGVNTLSVGYHSWTQDAMEYELSRRIKVSRVLGKAQGMMTLNSFLESNNIGFYPEIFIATSKGFDYAFGEFKFTTKGVGNDLSIHYPYNLATLLPDRRQAPTYFLSPVFYQTITNNVLDSFSTLGIKGVYASDLGNMRVGDFDQNKEIYASSGVTLQSRALQTLADEVSTIKLKAPFDYAFPYVDLAVSVPVSSSAYGIFDATIPFYQLVVSGLFDYTTDIVNGTSDKSPDWYFSKALETGSNLQFLLSYEDPKILLETDYTQYYKTYYANWKDTIIDLNQRINTANIHGGQLVNHEILAREVSRVTYSHGVVLVVNTGNRPYTHGTQVIAPYSYVVEGGN